MTWFCMCVEVLQKGTNYTLVKYENSGTTEHFSMLERLTNCQIFQFWLKSDGYYNNNNNNETL